MQRKPRAEDLPWCRPEHEKRVKNSSAIGALIQKLITGRQIMARAKDENWAGEVLERKINLQMDRH
jgi:hypothetical protein